MSKAQGRRWIELTEEVTSAIEMFPNVLRWEIQHSDSEIVILMFIEQRQIRSGIDHMGDTVLIQTIEILGIRNIP